MNVECLLKMSDNRSSTRQDNILRPALVLGSGFHRYVFGSTDQLAIRPLYDWHCLVEQVSSWLQVAVPSEVLSPVQRWETLVLRAVNERCKNYKSEWVKECTQQANLVEKEAPRAVANIINEVSQNYSRSTRSQIPLLDCWGAVISLNKDRPDFWRSKPFGIESIVCENWDEGWERVLLKARKLSS